MGLDACLPSREKRVCSFSSAVRSLPSWLNARKYRVKSENSLTELREELDNDVQRDRGITYPREDPSRGPE